MDKLYRRWEVEEILGLSESSIYEKIAKGTLPPPVKLGKRAVAWRESDLKEWIESLPEADIRKRRERPKWRKS